MSMNSKRAAHFLRVPELAYSPSNDALVRALLELGYEVDLFAPGGKFDTSAYGKRVRPFSAEYGRRWLLMNAFSPRWRRYSLFSGTTENPMGVVGVLSFLHRRPSVTLADEIFSGSYYGDAPEHWKRLCRWAMRRSAMTIVNDKSREVLQREYADIPKSADVIVYPGCYAVPPQAGDRLALRQMMDLSKDAIVIAVSGHFNMNLGAEWLIRSTNDRPNLHVAIQPLNMDNMNRFLLDQLSAHRRIYIDNRSLGWSGSWSSVVAFDIGLAIYLNDAPQFQNMGTSSQRLCMFLSMGIPVIASRQPSFEFLEKFECGVMVGNYEEFLAAVDYISSKKDEMRENALNCARRYIDAPGKYERLVQYLSQI